MPVWLLPVLDFAVPWIWKFITRPKPIDQAAQQLGAAQQLATDEAKANAEILSTSRAADDLSDSQLRQLQATDPNNRDLHTATH